MKCLKCYGIILFLLIVMITLLVGTVLASWTYTVRPGDTLWEIAQKTGVSVNSIENASGFQDDRIKPGQKVIIPDNSISGITSSDRELLARLVVAEASGEPYIGQVSVAAVILNRVSDPRFPSTIKGVVYQQHAFESVSNGLIWRRTPDAQAYKAVQDAINGWDPSYRSVFFWNPYLRVNPWVWSRPIITQYGNHVFAV
jgi:N-acetylmuramoyl-L-alanine amidase